MNDNPNETRSDQWLKIIKNNPVIASLIVISVVIGGLSALTESTSKVLNIFFPVNYNSRFKKMSSLVEANDPQKKIEGITMLHELSNANPSQRQALLTYLQKFIQREFPQNKDISKNNLPVSSHAIQTITTLPRIDANEHALSIDISQIRVQDLDLSRTNFKDVILWGSQFKNVILSHSDFRDADLGGVQFVDSSVEYSKFNGAKVTGSFMDKENGRARPTRFIRTRLYGSNLDKANLEFCEIINVTDFDLKRLGPCRILF